MLELKNISFPFESLPVARILIDVLFGVVGNADGDPHPGNKGISMRFLLERFVVDSEGSDWIDVDGDGGYLNIPQVEGLGHLPQFSILCETAHSIVNISLADVAFDICMRVGSSMPFCKFLEHLYFSFLLASLTDGGWRVGKYLCSIKSGIDHGVVRNWSLLSDLIGEGGVIEADDEAAYWYGMLLCDLLYNLRQHEVVYFSGVLPGWEVPGLEVVVSIGIDHFAPDCHYLRVVEDDPAVVEGCFVQDGATDIDNDAVADPWNDEIFNHVPGVENGVVFEVVVFAGVPWYLQFPTDSDGAVEPLALLDTLVDLAVVVFEVKGVVVETAEAYFNVKLP